MVAEEGDDQAVGSIFKDESPMQASAAFKVMAAQFADAEAAVQMGLAEFLAQTAQGKPAGLLVRFRQGGDFCLDGEENDERLFHAIVRG